MKISEAMEWLREKWDAWRGTRHDGPNVVVHMFVRDVRTFIIPYRSTHKAPPITARCEGTANDVEMALRCLRSLSNGSSIRHGATEIVCEAVRSIVQELLWQGYAAFEIGDLTSDHDDTYTKARRSDWQDQPYRPLNVMRNGLRLRLPIGMIEILDPHRRWKHEESVIRFYSRKRTWLIDMPRRLGGRWGFWLALKKLALFTGILPKWVSVTGLVKEQGQHRFDVSRYSRWQAAYQARCVSRWSWNGRDTSLTHQTEFFSFYRTLTFHHSLAILREHVMAEINLLLRNRLGLNAQINLEGIPSADEILAIRGRMERGEVSVMEAFDQATQ